MSNILQQSLKAVANGSRFHINLSARTLTLGKRKIISDGVYDGDLGIPPHPTPLSEIERLYRIYRHSLPSERSDHKRRSYFRALTESELSDEDMMFGTPREIAQLELELFILSQLLLSTLQWDEIAKGHWFWQSPTHPSLIILKQWIQPNN